MPTLDALRRDLDEIDDQFVALFARSQEAIRQIAAFKAESPAPLRDELREARQIARLTELARAADVDELFVVHLFRQILDFSVRTQEGRIGGGSTLAGVTDARPIAVVY